MHAEEPDDLRQMIGIHKHDENKISNDVVKTVGRYSFYFFLK